jgi:hemoglobin-like flavoprotein
MLSCIDAAEEDRPLSAEQALLVRQGFAQIFSMADTATAIFYRRLFELDPALKPLFRADLTEQGRKLMQMLEAAIGLLDRPQALAPTLEGLGRRHAGYGIRDEHYDTVEVALVLTLQQGLGAAFTREARSAWIALFDLIANTMKRATAAELELSEVQELAAAV